MSEDSAGEEHSEQSEPEAGLCEEDKKTLGGRGWFHSQGYDVFKDRDVGKIKSKQRSNQEPSKLKAYF